jgi:hypothetical protein
MYGFDNTLRVLAMQEQGLNRTGKKIIKAAAKELLRRYRLAIRKLKGPPHRPITVKLHGRHPLLRLTRAYFYGLRSKVVKQDKTKLHLKVGPLREDIHPGSRGGLSMHKLAQILEFGYPSNMLWGKFPAPIPARPHIVPTWVEFRRTKLGAIHKEQTEKFFKEFWRN